MKIERVNNTVKVHFLWNFDYIITKKNAKIVDIIQELLHVRISLTHS